MPEAKPTTVLWPDLKRFGLELTVAYNPSLGRNLLRMVVVDRELLASASGLDPNRNDFYQVARSAGFVYMPSETEARRRAAFWDADRRGLDLDAKDEAVQRELARLYFYSPSIAIRKGLLKTIVPALEDADFRQMAVSEVKHLDFRYTDDAQTTALLRSQQAFDGAEAGVLYTLPADRALLQRLAQRNENLHQALRLGGGQTPAAEGEVVDADLAAVAALHVVPEMQRLLGGQALLPEGTPLRTATAQALILGFTRREDAVAANGGAEDGIERVELPHALPLAFDYPVRRVLAARDGRYLEFGSMHSRDASTLEEMHGVQYRWSFLDRVAVLAREIDAATVAGVFEEASLTGAGLDTAAEEIAKLRGLMKSATDLVERYGKDEDPLSMTDVIVHSGVRHSALPKLLSPALSPFLSDFPALAARIEREYARRTADAIAAAGVSDALTKVDAVDAGTAATRREDAGEKIGGARKDYAQRWLSVVELDGMTVRERAEVVTKDNVWPAPDYAAMEADGVAPEVAYCIRELRTALPGSPYRGGYNIRKHVLKDRASRDLTLDECENFVRSVSLVRDALAGVQTKEDLWHAVVRIREESGTDRRGWNSKDWFGDGSGYHFSGRVLPEVDYHASQSAGTMSWSFHRFVQVAMTKTKSEWTWAAKKSRARAPTPEGEEESKKVRPEPEVPHLDHIHRVGADYRQGKHVDENLLMEVFGFRGVEYGNWLPQGERQLVLDHAFDAFMDMAAALKLPPKAMGLGGELALAFGARGRGGKRAACAHYESGRNVINLTRLSGAGALAHEWGHALDYFVAKSANVSQTSSLSSVEAKKLGDRAPIAGAFVALVDELGRRYQSFDEVLEDNAMTTVSTGKLSVVDILRHRCEEFVARLDRVLPEEKRGTTFREFARLEVDKLIVVEESDPRLARLDGVEAFLDNLTTALDIQIGREWRERHSHSHTREYFNQIDGWARNRIDRAAQIREKYQPKMFPEKSRFLLDGEYFDSFRSKNYWSTRVELFARAFEAWVQDRVQAEPGHKSQYLVFGREASPDAEYSGYPRGEERQRFGEAMSAFFEEHRPDLVQRMGLVQAPKAAAEAVELAA